MSRLYKKSTLALRECVVAPNKINLTADPISDDRDAPWSLAWDRVAGYRYMVEQIDEALIQAPILDATARKEYVSYCNDLAARRTKAARRVSVMLAYFVFSSFFFVSNPISEGRTGFSWPIS